MRENPVFVDAVFFENLGRVLISALLMGFVTRVANAEGALHAWTVVTIATGQTTQIFDPLLRAKAGCDAGEPTQFFPTTGWENCDDWKYAYGITWMYGGVTWTTCLALGGIGYILSGSEMLMEKASQLAIVMVTSASGIDTLNAYFRLYGDFSDAGWSGVLMGSIFFILAIGGFCLAESINICVW